MSMTITPLQFGMLIVVAMSWPVQGMAGPGTAGQSGFEDQFNYEERATLEVAELLARDVEFLNALEGACPEVAIRLPTDVEQLNRVFKSKFRVSYLEYLALLRPVSDLKAEAAQRAAGMAGRHDCKQAMLDPAIWEAEFAIPANLDQLRDSESHRRSLRETYEPRKARQHAEWLDREAEGKKQRLADAVIYSARSIAVVSLTSLQRVPDEHRKVDWRDLAVDHPVIEIREGWKQDLPRFIAIRPTTGFTQLGQALVVARLERGKLQFVPVLPDMIPIYIEKLGPAEWQYRPLEGELADTLNRTPPKAPISAY